MRQVGHDDFEQIVDRARDHVAGDHLGHGEHRVLEAAGTVVGMALDAHADEDGEAEADPRAIERRAIGLDIALAFQALHPAQAGRRRETDLLRQIDIGQPAVRLQRGDDLAVEGIQRHIRQDIPSNWHLVPLERLSWLNRQGLATTAACD